MNRKKTYLLQSIFGIIRQDQNDFAVEILSQDPLFFPSLKKQVRASGKQLVTIVSLLWSGIHVFHSLHTVTTCFILCKSYYLTNPVIHFFFVSIFSTRVPFIHFIKSVKMLSLVIFDTFLAYNWLSFLCYFQLHAAAATTLFSQSDQSW